MYRPGWTQTIPPTSEMKCFPWSRQSFPTPTYLRINYLDCPTTIHPNHSFLQMFWIHLFHSPSIVFASICSQLQIAATDDSFYLWELSEAVVVVESGSHYLTSIRPRRNLTSVRVAVHITQTPNTFQAALQVRIAPGCNITPPFFICTLCGWIITHGSLTLESLCVHVFVPIIHEASDWPVLPSMGFSSCILSKLVPKFLEWLTLVKMLVVERFSILFGIDGRNKFDRLWHLLYDT